MSIETDADRVAMLRALGARDDVLVRGAPVLGLYVKESQRYQFDDAQVSGYTHALRCLWSDVTRNEFATDDLVCVPDRGDFYIADIQDEDGLALIELRGA